jgi:uncharacterized protein (TIGR02996 family)
VIAFLDAIKETPDDDTPRLILADWLTENGDEARGEFIRVQCRLAEPGPDNPERESLAARETELREAHAGDWLGPLMPLVDREYYHRGLVLTTIRLDRLLQMAKEAPRWTEAWAWIESLGFHDTRSLSRVLLLTVFQHLTGLDFSGLELRDDGLEALLSAPHLNKLFSLNLRNCQISTTGVMILTQSQRAERLTVLQLYGNLIDDGGVAVLASALPPRLKRLDLSANLFRLANPRLANTLRGLRNLGALDLSRNNLHRHGVEMLAGIEWTGLTELTLDNTGIGDEEVKLLANSPGLSGLRVLSLSGNAIGAKGAVALAESPHLTGLKCLEICRNQIESREAAILRARFGNVLRLD